MEGLRGIYNVNEFDNLYLICTKYFECQSADDFNKKIAVEDTKILKYVDTQFYSDLKIPNKPQRENVNTIWHIFDLIDKHNKGLSPQRVVIQDNIIRKRTVCINNSYLPPVLDRICEIEEIQEKNYNKGIPKLFEGYFGEVDFFDEFIEDMEYCWQPCAVTILSVIISVILVICADGLNTTYGYAPFLSLFLTVPILCVIITYLLKVFDKLYNFIAVNKNNKNKELLNDELTECFDCIDNLLWYERNEEETYTPMITTDNSSYNDKELKMLLENSAKLAILLEDNKI